MWLRSVVACPFMLVEAERRCRGFASRLRDLIVSEHFTALMKEPAGASLAHGARSYAIRVAFFIENFGRMAGGAVRFDADTALLCGLFTNVYDHCLDSGEIPKSDAVTLVQDLEAGRYMNHCACSVRAMNGLYADIRNRLPEGRYALAYASLDKLHALQVESLGQYSATASLEFLEAISAAKGAAATTLFCAIARPELSHSEIAVVERMGAFFQYMDDFEDVVIDRAQGNRTLFTEDKLDARALWTQLVSVAKLVKREYYDVRPRETFLFIQGLYNWYFIASLHVMVASIGLRLWTLVPKCLSLCSLFPNSQEGHS